MEQKRLGPHKYGTGYRIDDDNPAGWVNHIDFDIFLLHNLATTPSKRILAPDSGISAAAVTAVNGLNAKQKNFEIFRGPDPAAQTPSDLTDTFVSWLKTTCPSGGESYNPSASQRIKLRPFLVQEYKEDNVLQAYLALANSFQPYVVSIGEAKKNLLRCATVCLCLCLCLCISSDLSPALCMNASTHMPSSPSPSPSPPPSSFLPASEWIIRSTERIIDCYSSKLTSPIKPLARMY